MKKFNNSSILSVLSISEVILILLLLLVVWVNPVFAHRSPETCSGSGLQINLYTDKPQVRIGDVISYSVDIFNGTSAVPISCDATDITAFIITPDGITHPITLVRTSLSNLELDSYLDVVTYIARSEDVQSDDSLKASAGNSGIIHQNDINSTGGGDQQVNTTIIIPATLHIIKEVVNDDDGIATASLFNLYVKLSGTDVLGSPAVGVASPGTLYTLDAGTYIVSEDENASYAKTFSGDCDSSGTVVLVAGGDKTCTIINNDVAPVVVPPSGGGGRTRRPPTPPIVLTASVVDAIPAPPPVVPVVATVPSLPRTGFFSDHENVLWNYVVLLGDIVIVLVAFYIIFKEDRIDES